MDEGAFSRLEQKVKTGALLDVEEAALLLGISKHTIRAYIARREIPYFKVGAAVRLEPEAILRWRDARRVPTLAEEFRAERAAAGRGAAARGAE